MTYFPGMKIIDTAGVAQGVLMDAGSLTVRDYLFAVTDGSLVNHSPWVVNGYNGALSAASEDMWSVGGVYVFPAAAQQMEIVSSSVNDAAAGTGVRTVNISYLDAAFGEHVITLTMNGTTPVPTGVSDIYRVNYVQACTVGTGGLAAGNIDIRTLTTGTHIYGRIQTGQNIEKDLIYTVPFGKKLFVTNILFSAAGNVANRPVTFTTRTTWDRIFAAARNFFLGYTEVTIVDGSIDLMLEMPTYLPAGTDIKVSAISPDGATYASVVLRGWLETV
jgi:hypothetical protein